MVVKIITGVLLMVASAGYLSAGDYPAVPKEHAEVILKMEEGAEKDAVKLPRGKVDFKWRLFTPEKADKKKPLPLVVFLHGAGRRGDDNVGPMELAWSFITPEAQKENPCFVLAGQVQKGRGWTPFLAQRDKLVKQGKEIAITDEMTALLKVVDRMLKERPIDKKRVYVVGQSMGGYGTWDALERRPELFAAAVPICGGGSPEKAKLFKDVPIWAWHGEKDTTVPVKNTRDMIDALKEAGGKPIYTEVPGCGHGVWGKTFAAPKLYEWLFAQKKK
ncbi:MAG: prolyl oligopeptidase family serine peptidase [Planctomycetes bacterium]|nr:prolyl oligopeptidase family serine peptidase [Planctomycetota bacterium]